MEFYWPRSADLEVYVASHLLIMEFAWGNSLLWPQRRHHPWSYFSQLLLLTHLCFSSWLDSLGLHTETWVFFPNDILHILLQLLKQDFISKCIELSSYVFLKLHWFEVVCVWWGRGLKIIFFLLIYLFQNFN